VNVFQYDTIKRTAEQGQQGILQLFSKKINFSEIYA
jgi:hypothetical protein